MELVFVFDGKPPSLKMRELEKRRQTRRKAEEEYREAIERGDLPATFSKAVMTGGLTRDLVDDAKHLLDLLGIPWVQAPSEGEAQAAYMANQGHTSGRPTSRTMTHFFSGSQDWSGFFLLVERSGFPAREGQGGSSPS